MSSKTFTPSALVDYFEAGGFGISKRARYYFRVYGPTDGTFVCGVHIDKKGEHVRLTTERFDVTVNSYATIAATLHKFYSDERDRMNAVVCGIVSIEIERGLRIT